MYEPLLSALLHKLAEEPAHDAADPWPAVRARLRQSHPTNVVPGEVAPESGDRVLAIPRRSARRLRRLATTGIAAAAVAAVLTAGLLQPWNRPSSANAAEALEGLRSEAFSVAGPVAQMGTGSLCQANGVFATTGGPVPVSPIGAGVVQIGPGGDGPVTVAPPPNGTPEIFFNIGVGGPVGAPPADGTPGAVFQYRTGPGANAEAGSPPSAPNATDLSDRLGQALGISGDRVREAMRQTIAADLPPIDPLARIATQLGVTRDQVQEAFGDPSCPGMFMIKLNAPASDLSGPAAKLGVTPERLAAALAAAAPPIPPSIDSTINRLAQNLGISPEQLRAALTQVEGPNTLYLTAPRPSGSGLLQPLGTPVPAPTQSAR